MLNKLLSNIKFKKERAPLNNGSVLGKNIDGSGLNKNRRKVGIAVAAVLLPGAAITVGQGCTLERDGLAVFPPGTDAGIGGEAGNGGAAGTINTAGAGGMGGSAGTAGTGGSAGEGGCFPTEEICDGEDNDCNDQVDDNVIPPLCDKTMGVCSTPAQYPECDGENGWTQCEYNSDYEDGSETKCDNKDNDCDGAIDEMSDLDSHQPSCTEPDQGVCAGATAARTCNNGQWSACDYGPNFGSETCDQLDNNCDGNTDEGCVTILHNSHDYEQLVTPDENTNTPLPGSTGNGACETVDTTFMVNSGNVQMIYLKNGVNNVTLKTSQVSPSLVEGGCAPFLNCPTNSQLWSDFQSVVKDTNITSSVNGDETTYTHNQTCGTHEIFVTW